MTENNFVSLKRAAEITGVPQHVISYGLRTGKIPEPEHLSNRRMFGPKDLDNIVAYANAKKRRKEARCKSF